MYDGAPHQITDAAIGDMVKEVAARLSIYPSMVYRMKDTPTADRYSRFIALYYAVSDRGAELYFQDFKARHTARMGSKKLKTTSMREAIGLSAEAHGKLISLVSRPDASLDEILQAVASAVECAELIAALAQKPREQSLAA